MAVGLGGRRLLCLFGQMAAFLLQAFQAFFPIFGVGCGGLRGRGIVVEGENQIILRLGHGGFSEEGLAWYRRFQVAFDCLPRGYLKM